MHLLILNPRIMKAMHWIVWLLVFVGALNWGLVGAFEFNLVSTLLGAETMAEKVVYIVVGVAAVLSLVDKGMCCKGMCEMKK